MKRVLIIIGVVLLAGATGAAAWVLWPRHQTYYSDAGDIREPAESARLREILWQPPAPMSAEFNSSADEYEPRVLADGRMMFFVRGKPGRQADIFYSLRTSDGWQPAEPLAAINTEYDDLGPEISPDGRTLYFYSDRPGGVGGYDLWKSQHADSGWQPPINLGTWVNSEFNEYGPAVSPDGNSIVFASNRPREEPDNQSPKGAWQATIREDPYRHDYDIYQCAMTDAGLSAPQRLDQLNSNGNEGAPAFSPAGDFLYFSSDRTGGFGGFDLYRARLVRGAIEPPTNLGAAVNSIANELDPSLEMGGYALHFSSDRPVVTVLKDTAKSESASADYNLYRTVSREVFREVETRHASIDWAGIWRLIGPNLLMAILALLLSLLLLALLRDMKQRRLSLLARCLLTSLLVHLLLMMLLNVVEVTTSIASAFRKSDRIQISLASTAQAGEIAMQLRGDLTDAAVPQPIRPSPSRAEVAVQLPTAEPIATVSMESVPHTPDSSSVSEPDIREAVPSDSPLDAPSPRVPDVAPNEFVLDAPREASPIDAREAPAEFIPRPADLGEVRRAETPWPTSQPAMDLSVVAIAPEISRAQQPLISETVFAASRSASESSAPPARATEAIPIEFNLPVEMNQFAELSTPSEMTPQQSPPDSDQSDSVHFAAQSSPLGPGIRAAASLPPASPTHSIVPTPISPQALNDSLVIDGPLVQLTTPVPDSAIAINTEESVDVLAVDTPALSSLNVELALPTEVASPTKPESGAIGTIRGTATDVQTLHPLSAVKIQLDLPGHSGVTATTAPNGEYIMLAPNVPEHFALSASAPGYLPRTVNVAAADLIGQTLVLDFPLRRIQEDVIAIESDPEVHHLGNDRFEGRINSQFQRQSEGERFRATFTLTKEQLAQPMQSAAVEMLIKGVQCPHQIRINGRRLDRRLSGSPLDGSFGAFVAPFDPDLLRAGRNTLVIRNVICRDDIDDFEFVNIQLRLVPAAVPSSPAGSSD